MAAHKLRMAPTVPVGASALIRIAIATAALIAIGWWSSPRADEGKEVASQNKDRFSAEDRNYWALQPVARPALPEVSNPTWSRNAIDRFIAARLDRASLVPAAEADRRTVYRRWSFDLVGLPPDASDMSSFVANESPDAAERAVDRLLASPGYGERWGRHWLDLARYAETDGFKADNTRPSAWRYRDYVIRALNADKPYDQFLSEQIAGDEIAPHDADALVATGFLRHWPYEDNGRDVFGQRANILNDVTDVTAQVSLGLTYQCARCHDHKFDPILQRDYYRLQAFFVAMVPRDDLVIGSPEALRDHEHKHSAWTNATAAVRQQIESIEAPVREKMRREQMGMFPKEVQAVLAKNDADRTPEEQIIADLAGKQLSPDDTAVSSKMAKDVRERWTNLRKQMASVAVESPPALPKAMGVRDLGPDAPEVKIPGVKAADSIAPGFLTILDAQPAAISSPSATSGEEPTTGRRAALARWIASGDNPLTSRVIVNRLWQHHFGVGIVATPSDFGRQGVKPTHPELLDYLADELSRQQQWSLKQLHRMMVTSAAYRQASSVPASDRATEVDPENHLLWRMRMRRIEAEALRDSVLAASGELNQAMGGASTFPELPKELSERYGWKPSARVEDRNRRSVYLFAKRNMRLPLFDAFDAPDTHETCCRRDQTTTAPQALTLLNDQWMLARAAEMAARVKKACGDQPRQQVEAAWRFAFNRDPSLEESTAGVSFLSAAASPNALADYCHVLLNANEFLYVD